MNAIQAIKRDRFYSEARYIMDKHDLPASAFDSVYGDLQRRAFLEEIEPYQRQLTFIYSLAIPQYLRHADGTLTKNGDGLTDEMRELADKYREVIDGIRQKYQPYGS